MQSLSRLWQEGWKEGTSPSSHGPQASAGYVGEGNGRRAGPGDGLFQASGSSAGQALWGLRPCSLSPHILRNSVGGSAFPLTLWPGEGGKMGLQGPQGDRPATVTWSPTSGLPGPLLRGTTKDHDICTCVAHAASRALGVAVLTRPQALPFPCSTFPRFCVWHRPF